MDIAKALLKGPLGGVLKPVSNLMGTLVGAAVSSFFDQNMKQTTDTGVSQRVNEGVRSALLPSLTTSLLRPLTATASVVRGVVLLI